jgi:hypothetical protein
MLISTLLIHVKVADDTFYHHFACQGYLSLPSCAACRPGAGPPLRRGSEASRHNQWPVFADDVAEPTGTADDQCTTLTAALKPLERRGLIETFVDPDDRRLRRIGLTPDGERLLAVAVPIWKETHERLESQFGEGGSDRLRADLLALI